ncbi:MAG: hypothetical protein HRT88_00850 [Lentisphaeraceae bacterium]|nr:hypothetical protein [Lentisphaeraceae bacterium]
MDPQGVSYVFSGKAVLRRSRQTSYAASTGDQKILGPSSENDFATAWLDHGKAPQNGAYEYTVLINESAEKVQDFARKFKNPKLRPYKVIQKNTQAHIVHDRQTGIRAYAIFEGDFSSNDSLLLASKTPALLMCEAKSNKLLITVCDPVLRFKGHVPKYAKVSMEFLLAGKWQLAKKLAKAHVEAAGDNTRLVITGPADASTLEDKLKRVDLQN